MTSRDAIAILCRHADDLRARGIRHAAIFGSVARGEAGSDSDTDILLELDRDARFDLFAYAGLKSYIASLFPGRVDVINKAALKPHLRRPAERQTIHAF